MSRSLRDLFPRTAYDLKRYLTLTPPLHPPSYWRLPPGIEKLPYAVQPTRTLAEGIRLALGGPRQTTR